VQTVEELFWKIATALAGIAAFLACCWLRSLRSHHRSHWQIDRLHWQLVEHQRLLEATQERLKKAEELLRLWDQQAEYHHNQLYQVLKLLNEKPFMGLMGSYPRTFEPLEVREYPQETVAPSPTLGERLLRRAYRTFAR